MNHAMHKTPRSPTNRLTLKMSKFVRQEKSQRKHPVYGSTTPIIKAPVVPTAPKERPGWKGPGFVRKGAKSTPRPSAAATTSSAESVQDHHLPVELQQLVLNIFSSTLPICQDYEALKTTLQQVRDKITEGDWERAFRSREWMEAYAVRWSPNRALCYANILLGICEEFGDEPWIDQLLSENSTRAVCFGGNIAELMAFGAVLRYLSSTQGRAKIHSQSSSTEATNSLPEPSKLVLYLIDLASWSPILTSFLTSLTTPPTLSKYASATAQANNKPLLPLTLLTTTVQQSNILNLSQDTLGVLLGPSPTLTTLFFTLRDLYASSIAKSAAFLLKLTLATPKDTLLLIIDNIDDQSTKKESDHDTAERKKYPLRYLLDLAMLDRRVPREPMKEKPGWENLISDQKRVFKMAEGLRYPISLENLRVQVYLFRRL